MYDLNYKQVVVDSSTLAASYGSVTGYVELHKDVNNITLYFGFKAGTNADSMKALISFSGEGGLYFPECNDEIQLSDTILRAKEYTMVDAAGASPITVPDEYLGDLIAIDVSATQTYLSNKQRLKFNLIPVTATTPVIRHSGTAFGTVTEKANNAAFTAPGALGAGTVEWSQSTGDLNFSNADLASYVGQTIKVDYTTKYNLFRTLIPVSDHYVKVSLKDVAAAGHGTGFCWLTTSPKFK